MEDAELKGLWGAGKRAEAGAAWTAEEIASFRERRSRSLAAYLVRKLTADLAWKALVLLALGFAAYLVRHDPGSCAFTLAAMLATVVLSLPVIRAHRAIARSGGANLRTSASALLAEIARFRRSALLSLAATSGLVVAAGALLELASEHGVLRPDRPMTWAVCAALAVVASFSTWRVVDARVSASTAALGASLLELDPDALAAISGADRRARVILILALVLVAALLAVGLLVLLASL